MRKLTGSIVLAVVLLTQTGAANAITTTFYGMDYGAGPSSPRPESNAAAALFNATANPVTVIDFESLSTGSVSTMEIAQGVVATYGSPTFGGRNPVIATTTGFEEPRTGYNTTSGGKKFLQLYGGAVTLNFAEPIIGFGTYITGMNANGASIEFTDGTPRAISFPPLFSPGIFGGSAFVGFVNTSASIRSVTFRTTASLGVADLVAIDDLRFISAVPEPSSLKMFGSAILAALAASFLRVRRQNSRH